MLKFHFIYKTTNIINKRFYVGRHSTDNIQDNYLGSGIALLGSIQKYGADSFTREVLEFCENIELLLEREEFWIKELDAIKKGYNITNSSCGGNLDCIEYKDRFIEDITCPYCGFVSKNKPMMYNIHFGNCKQNPDFNVEEFTQRKLKSDATRRKSVEYLPVLVCKWCGFKNKNRGVFYQFHEDNCKFNPNYSDDRNVIECPHCKVTSKNEYLMRRYHFDNCVNNPVATDETLLLRKVKDTTNISKANNSKSKRDAISKANTGKLKSEETKLLMRENWDYSRPILQCPYCPLTSRNSGNMKRYHFDNCKLNTNKN